MKTCQKIQLSGNLLAEAALRCDRERYGCGYLPRRNIDKPALVVELKWNKSAKGAIVQIKER